MPYRQHSFHARLKINFTYLSITDRQPTCLSAPIPTTQLKAENSSLSALFFSGGNGGGNKKVKRKSPYDFHRKGLILLVAGKGFEPMTFGL